MKQEQRRAIDEHYDEIFDKVTEITEVFLTYLIRVKVLSPGEGQMVDAEKINEAKLDKLLRVVKTKDNGWQHVIAFFNSKNLGPLTAKLLNSAGETVVVATSSTAPQRQVDKEKAIQDHQRNLVPILEGEVEMLVSHMLGEGALDLEMKKLLEKETTDKAILIRLFQWAKFRDDCWDSFIRYLQKKHPRLATNLKASAGITA